MRLFFAAERNAVGPLKTYDTGFDSYSHIYDQLKHADQPVVNVLLEQFMLVQCIIFFFVFYSVM